MQAAVWGCIVNGPDTVKEMHTVGVISRNNRRLHDLNAFAASKVSS